MKRKVYRSLDRPSSFFGIRGRFMLVMLAMTVAGLVPAVVVGRLTSMIFGFGALLLVAVAAYFVTTSLQAKIDEKDILKVIVRKRFPDVYRVRTKSLRNIWKGFNL